MKFFSKTRKNIIGTYRLLKCPNKWPQFLLNHKTKFLSLFVLYVILGISLQQQWNFPHFYEFMFCFLFIGCLGMAAISYFTSKMKYITSLLAHQPAARKGNYFYHRYCSDSVLYILGPLLIIFVFGIGGCAMFGAIRLTPTLIWILVLFFFVVHTSIIGYLQYIALAFYIRNLAYSSDEYKYLEKTPTECIPAKLAWLQELTRLSHTYRSAFFTLGSAYILAFGAFCWLPEMQADRTSFAFYLLWGIIFCVIVILFPVVSLLEYGWIKEIVGHLKDRYILDLALENQISSKTNLKMRQPLPYHQLIHTICATQILNSKDYPITSTLTTCYAAILSFFNFLAAIMTVLQGLPLTNLLNVR